MKTYVPLFLDLRRNKILVVGGGGVAARRVQTLLHSGAEIFVLTNVPFGYGNLKNLEAAEFALENKPVLLIEETPIEQRDFTQGEAKKIYTRLKNNGAIVLHSPEEVLPIIEKMAR